MVPNNVILTKQVEKELQALFHQISFSSLGILVDEHTKEHCYPLIKNALPAHELLIIKSGEQEKNLTTCQLIWEWLTNAQFDRQGLLINLGGGVIGDMGGFCAATYKRGIKFINIPTTLLSQADAAIGGKLGVDFQGYKNHIGVFQDPYYIVVSPEFLDTLPERQLKSGFAEIIKHCLIADSSYWPAIYNCEFGEQDWPEHIKHSIEVKFEVVAEDPKEQGLRKILNFGHTIGHAIESFYLGSASELLHGEAIAIGMICESYLANKFCSLPAGELDQIVNFLLKNFSHVRLKNEDKEKITSLALQDKKNEKQKIKASLLNKLGEANYNVTITPSTIQEALTFYQNLEK